MFTHADDSLVSKAIISVCLCDSVYLFVCTITKKTNDPKVFKLGIWNDLGIAYMQMV